MEIKNTAMAGTLESSDISITIEANDNGIEINLKSSVEKQFINKERQNKKLYITKGKLGQH